MHEISLLESILDILENYAETQEYTLVKKVCLEVGQLSGVQMEALRFSFDVIMKDTLAEHAELEIFQAEGMGICEQCQQMVAMQTEHALCSLCGCADVKITQGTELRIKEIVVI
jgi:hydrogenase nickel incorporation protein HypA/HybF